MQGGKCIVIKLFPPKVKSLFIHIDFKSGILTLSLIPFNKVLSIDNKIKSHSFDDDDLHKKSNKIDSGLRLKIEIKGLVFKT